MIDLPDANVRIPARRRPASAEAANHLLDSKPRACLSDRLPFASEPNALEGIAAAVSGLFEAFEKMAGDPSNFGRRHAVVRCAQKVAAQFQQAASRLGALENDLNASLLEDVARANHQLNDIACLNRLIVEAQAEGGAPDLLARQRAHCLEALSIFAGIATDPNDDASLNLTIAGVVLVRGSETVDTLAAYPARNGSFCVRAHQSGLPLALDSGRIAEMIAARDGGLADLQKGLNALAGQLILRVNTIYKTGRDLNGGTGRNFFTGSCAADMGVNRAVINDPAKLQIHAGDSFAEHRNDLLCFQQAYTASGPAMAALAGLRPVK